MQEVKRKRMTAGVLRNDRVSQTAFVLRFERNGMQFTPGQHLIIGPRSISDMREYSIYSAPGDPFLEVLVREVSDGYVSRFLGGCGPGDELTVEGPAGSFTVPPASLGAERFLFVATGTGIAPFRSFVRSYPALDYTLLHGVRSEEERFGHEAFSPERLTFCTSRSGGGTYRGRVTDYLRGHTVESDRLCYLCGSADMIYEAHGILTARGVPRERIFAEIYF